MEKTAHTKMDLELMMESSDLSKAEYNFVCAARICKDVIKLPLIDVLAHYISPNELYNKIRSCSMLITGKNKLSPDQLKCCFCQPPLLPDYKTFDCPLLYKLIRHLCPSLRPVQGCGIEPKHPDTLIGDDIECLRLLSIYISLRSKQMSDERFEEFLNTVRYYVGRFQNLAKNWSNYNYEEELNKIVPKKLGYKYPKKEEQHENMQLTLMSSKFSGKKDEPLIDGAEKAICESTVQFNVHVKPANTSEWPDNWQKNRTGGTEQIDMTSRHPYVLTRCISNNKNRSVTLIANVSATGENSKVQTVYWSKNGEIIDTQSGGRVYMKMSDKNISLIIHNVNHQDAGSYRFTASSSAWSKEAEIVIGVPKITIERREKQDGSQCFIANIKSIPEPYRVQWKVKRNGHEKFSLIDVNDPEYKGTSNSLHCPVLVVEKKEQLENQCFHIKVDNFIGSSIEDIFDTPIRYFFYQPAQDFEHFHYVHNLIRDCKFRVKQMLFNKGQKDNFMSKDVIIKIGIAGHFHEENLNLISRGTWKETITENQQIWDVSLLLFFQNDLSLKTVHKIARQESAWHRIIITSDTVCKKAIKTEDTIIIVGKNKQKIKKIITICLEKPFHQILNKWFEDFRNEGKLATEIIAEIKEIRKCLVFEKSKLTAAGLQGGCTEFTVPDNVKNYLFRLSYVNSFGIWENSSLKVFAKKKTDENKIKRELFNINKFFFDNFHLEITKGKFEQKKTLKQGDLLLASKQCDLGMCYTGTLGGFVRKNDNKGRIYGLTCNHIFPEEKQLAYAKVPDGFREIGACVFTTRENACDFAAIELRDSFVDGCDVTVRREDKKKVNAKIYTGSLHNVGLVHKIGAATGVTSGRIMSLEYYDKEMDSHCRNNIFLVKGLNGPFSEEGDSGSLVFCRPNSVIQNYVNVLGMVFAQNIKLNNDGDADDYPNRTSTAFNAEDNLSVCYRIHTALELFKASQDGECEVKFQEDYSVTLSSSSSRSSSSS